VSVTIESKDAAAFLRKLDIATRKRVRVAMQIGAERGRSIMVRRTPVDTGETKAAWKVFTTAVSTEAARLVNDAPHVGIIETGARPHPVSDVGILAIERWVARHSDIWQAAQDGGGGHMLTKEQAIAAVTHGIVWKLRTLGQEPTYFIRNALPALRRAMAAEVRRLMKDILNSPPRVG